MKKNIKIFIGFSEIANFINSYKKGFEAIGYTTFTVTNSRNKYYPKAKYDIVLSEIKGKNVFTKGILGKIWRSLHARVSCTLIFFRALLTCQVFYYNTGGNILPFRLDYILIRLFKKKLVIVFLGSEIRHWYLYKKEIEKMGFGEMFATCIEAYKNQKFSNYFDKLERVKAAETYANLILSQPGYGQLQTKPYMRVTVGLYLPDYNFVISSRRRPLIVHAPTARGIKGTEYIIDAVNRLNLEGYEFDFKLIENMANHDLIKLLENSDIVIDELNSDTIGVLSTEAMATGNAVLTGYLSDFVKVPIPCPVINSNRFNIYENLKKLLIDEEYRKQLSTQGRVYVETHHNIEKIAARELKWLFSKLNSFNYDFIPNSNYIYSIPSEIINAEK
jgi:glycosyltransferase involved in cell wall biosynthesis